MRKRNRAPRRAGVAGGRCLLLVAVAAVAVAATPAPLRFGPRQVWHPSPAAIAGLQKCATPISADCVQKVMKQQGARAEAFEFYRQTGWFLSELKGTGGPVMLGSVVNPWRANENEQPALLGGTPAVIYPEDVKVRLESDPGFKTLQADFPKLLFWKPGPTLETKAVTAAGQRFVFRYRLLDGCHACPIRGWGRIAFDFAQDGTFGGARIVDVIRQ